MINLRYHIVSITAVFLALGIGVALGGTFLDKYTVDVLDKNISSAEARIKETNAENSRLEKNVADAQARDESLTRVAGAELLDGHLTDVPVMIVTAPDVSSEVLSDLRLSLDQSGADLRGTLELRESLDFADDVPDDLAALVDVDPTDPGAAAAVTDAFRKTLIDAGAPASDGPDPDPELDPTSTTTTVPADDAGDGGAAPTTTLVPGDEPGEKVAEGPDGTQPDVVTALIASDYLRLTPGPARTAADPLLETTGYRYVFVSGPEVDQQGNDLLLSLLPSGPPAELMPAVVVSASVPTIGDREDKAATAVDRIRGDNDLARVYVTIDNIDTFTGLVATVFEVEDIDTVEVGHYGQASGATSILPPSS